jgi:hypothetical protein
MIENLHESIQRLFTSEVFIIALVILLVICCYLIYKVVGKTMEIIQTGKERRRFFTYLIKQVEKKSTNQSE